MTDRTTPLSVIDDILYQLQSKTFEEEMEGRFEAAEALADNAYTVLSQIQDVVPPDQQADVLAEYLRESGFSSHVVEQMLGIPRQEVDAALEAAGYGPTGLSLTAPVGPGTNIPTTVTSGGTSGGTINPLQGAVDAVVGSDIGQAAIEAGKAVGTEVGKIIDKVFQTLGLPAPTKIIGKPNQQAGTIVWGQTGGAPVVYTGTTPGGTQTGVTTGLPWLDAVVNRGIQIATGQSQIPDVGQISTVVIQEAAREALGLPPGADMGQITGAVQQAAQAAPQIFSMAEDTEGTDRFGIDLTGVNGETKAVTNENGAAAAVTNENGAAANQVVRGDDALVTDKKPNIIKEVITPEVPEDETLRGGVEARDDLKGSVAPSVAGAVDTSGAVRGGLGSFFTSGGEGMDVRGSINPYEYETRGTLKTQEIRDDVRGDVRGGSGFTLPSSLRGVREEPGELVNIDYLYDFAKGLDQPFITTEEQEALQGLNVYAEGGEVANEDAVDMLTRRPGQYGRRYFTDGQFSPTGTALGGAALDPNQIQIPEYTYQRELLPQFGGPEAGTTTQATMPSGTNLYTPPTLSDTLGQDGLDTILANISGLFGGGAGEVDTEGFVSTPDVTETIYTTTPVQNPVQEYLSSLGYGTSPKSITKEDVAAFMGQQDFSLGDIASALGTTEDVLNQIYNFQPTAATTTITPASGTASLTPLQEYLVGQGFGSARDITKEDIADFGTSGFDIGDIASALGVTTSDLNAIANYTAPTPDPDQALYDFFLDRGFVGTTKDVTPEDIAAAEIFLAENPQFTVDDMAAMLGITEGYATGGMAQGQGYYLGGPTDGMADLVPATIDGTQPAALSDGEFVIPADVVSHLGNGNSEAGAQQLYSMMDRVRQERTGTTRQGPEINPTKMMPA